MNDKRMALLADGPRAGEWVEVSDRWLRMVDPMEPLGPLLAVKETDSVEIPSLRIREYRIEPAVLGTWRIWVAVSEHQSSRDRERSILRALLQRDVFARLERAQ